MSDRLIKDYQGASHAVKCIGCYINGLDKEKTSWVYISERFHAHQDFEVPIPGFIILATVRHIHSIDEMTPEEAKEFMDVLIEIRAAQRKVLGIDSVYLIQEEDTEDHFHVWLLPRYPWMKDEARFGRKVASARAVLDYAKQNMKTHDVIFQVSDAVQKIRSIINAG